MTQRVSPFPLLLVKCRVRCGKNAPSIISFNLYNCESHTLWIFLFSLCNNKPVINPFHIISRYIGKKHLQTAMRQVLSSPLSNSQTLAFAVIRVPFFLEPDYDDSLPFVESNRDRLLAKWGGKEGWEKQKRRHEYVVKYLSPCCACFSWFVHLFVSTTHVNNPPKPKGKRASCWNSSL